MKIGEAPAHPAEVWSPSRDRVERFTLTERWAHWVQAASFIVLLLTGFGLMLPAIEGIVGHREVLREIHLTGAFFLFFGPALIALSANRAAMAADVREVDRWDQDDFRWLAGSLGSGKYAPQGRFNAGQKLNAIFVVWSTIMFSFTGLVLWQNRRFPSDLVSQSNTIHSTLAYVALGAFLGHVYLATLSGPTRHSLRGMTQGWVRRDWAEHHHLKWVLRMRPPAPPGPYDAVRAAAQIVVGAAACLFFSRLLFAGLGANTTDKVTGRLYALTAWPGEGHVPLATGVRVLDSVALGYLIILIAVWVALDQMRRKL